MEMYFGVGGELLTPLDEMLDVDIKLSLELDLELKDPINSGVAACEDWDRYVSLRSSPTLDIFGEKEACILVSPEAVMPFIKREIKQEPPPRVPSPKVELKPEDTWGLLLECPQDQEVDEIEVDEETLDEPVQEEEEEEEDEDDEDEEEEDEESEEEERPVEEVKPEPTKERNVWNSVFTKPAVLKTENTGLTTFSMRQKTEVIVSKSPSTKTHFQTVKVLHAAKKFTTDSSPNSRSLLVKRGKETENGYPKPAYSYSCLIAMALKNSITGSLPVSEIYNFMCEHFPYFKSAPTGWKNSVRHNLSLNKCFEKIEKGGGGGGCRKGCLWAMNPAKIAKMDDEVAKWSKKDPAAIRRSMKYPDELERLERGDLKIGARRESCDSGAEDDSDSSDSDTEEVPPSLKRFDSRLSSQESNDLGLPDEMYEELGLLEEVMSSDNEPEPGHEVKRIRLGLEPYQRQPVRPV